MRASLPLMGRYIIYIIYIIYQSLRSAGLRSAGGHTSNILYIIILYNLLAASLLESERSLRGPRLRISYAYDYVTLRHGLKNKEAMPLRSLAALNIVGPE